MPEVSAPSIEYLTVHHWIGVGHKEHFFTKGDEDFWENRHPAQDVTDILNALAPDGWELAFLPVTQPRSCLRYGYYHDTYLFVRVKPDALD